MTKIDTTTKYRLPGSRPTCEHGYPVGGFRSCPDCHKRDMAIDKSIKPLVEEYWENRGSRDLAHLFRKAYRMGMKHNE